MKDLKVKKSGTLIENSSYERFLFYGKGEVSLATEMDVKNLVSNLAKLGVKVTKTKSRLEMLKALAPPAAPKPQHG
ncbi:Lmo0850 family protein [Chryseomicrobium aureum]|uniref:Lmo0850 family protein n=1 Tax=Chryseomicrobium aureum TaxID=1441723 RepID=UPI001958C4C0|nr:hypothetical protein [Chryseomicrobium aureum]